VRQIEYAGHYTAEHLIPCLLVNSLTLNFFDLYPIFSMHLLISVRGGLSNVKHVSVLNVWVLDAMAWLSRRPAMNSSHPCCCCPLLPFVSKHKVFRQLLSFIWGKVMPERASPAVGADTCKHMFLLCKQKAQWW